MIIRFATEIDLASIIKLCKAHAQYEKSDFNETNKTELLSQHLFALEPDLKCLVVEYNKKIVGYSTFIKQFSTWEAQYYVYIDCLFLTENIRGNGIGKQVMEKIKEYAQSANCSVIQWQTPDFNTRAIKFYHNLGAESKSKERFTWKI
ncbi:GNAT family N-acetyltransferase [Chryseobacterium sp. 3008163]|uniref:GNAT family N-acetyltransferase n=1 Tax=Chryseobacterium sp. 3008163 TaxID=2478663 RepID=UPI000F0C1507|nr:GNAT family N-acetyltransferase [Chryseobacterium sp. 3008163]AYN00602.1 GNAT family N-acetyltransferase [Chryseobacterium sp. 3008163]